MSPAPWTGGLLLALSLGLWAAPATWLPLRDHRSEVLAWRNRAVSAGFTIGFLCLTQTLLSDPRLRVGVEQLFIVTLGYSHLLAALVFTRRRGRARQAAGRVPPSRAWTLVLWGGSLALFAAYWYVFLGSLRLWVPFLLPAIAINVWHIVENDLLVGRAYGGRLRLGPLPQEIDLHLLSMGLTALVFSVAMAVAQGPYLWPGLHGELFLGVGNAVPRGVTIGLGALLVLRNPGGAHAAPGALLIGAGALVPDRIAEGRWMHHATILGGLTLYHLISWLVFFTDRSRRVLPGVAPTPAWEQWRRILALHLPFFLLCAAVVLWPRGRVQLVGLLLLGWASYLFWSVLHVFQTLWARSRARTLQSVPPTASVGSLAEVVR